MGTRAYLPLVLNPAQWLPTMYGWNRPPEQRNIRQPRVTEDWFFVKGQGPFWLHWLGNWLKKGLVNDDQAEALALGLLRGERLSLIQGPPGTGKVSRHVGT
jgi:hypothetical protein